MADDRVARPVRKRHKTSHYFPNGTPFWDRVDKSGGEDACWPWMAGRSAQRYGQVTINGNKILAHRYAYAEAYGPIPADKDLLHSCDNPPCCNPRHLRIGTAKDNAKDMIDRGRIAYGSRHGQCRFTDEAIRTIRDAYHNKGLSQGAISRKFGISSGHLHRVLTGQARKYVK
jgi:hypothetical protein